MQSSTKRSLKLFSGHVLPLFVSIVLFGFISIIIFSSYIIGSTNRTATSTLNQAVIYYDAILDEMDAVSIMLAANPELIFNLKTIQDSNQMSYNSFRETKLIKSFLSSSADSRPVIDNIYLFVDNRNNYVLQSDKGFDKIESMPQREWLSQYMLDSGTSDISSYPLTITRDDITFGCIRFARPILNMNNEKSGVLVIDLKSSYLEEYFRMFSNSSSGYLEVENEYGDLLFTSGSVPRGRTLSFQDSSEKYGWRYRLSFPLSIVFSPTLPIIYLMVLSLVAVGGIGFLVTYKANKEERKFINSIASRLIEAGAENLPKEVGKGKSIFETLNELIIEHFIEHDFQKVKGEAMEYRALQLQINPHFLYNTLDTIYWKAIKTTGSENDTAMMVKLLSDLMKHALRFDNLKGIPLEEELEAVRKYISIQHFRFRDRFQYKEDIEDELMDMPVPSMIFQPLLENAFNHGFMEDRTLRIVLSGRREDDRVVFTISNDGKPFEEALMEKLRKKDFNSLRKSSSLGLSNTVERLDLFYHHASSISFCNDEGLVKITISVPYPIP